jgi:predicted glycosyltransferase
VLTSIDDTYSYLQAADLVVAMAGYNTTVEILQTGRRAIQIPRRGPSAEQRTRTQLFAQRGWIDMLDPDDLSADTLAALVTKNLRLGPTVSTVQKPNLNGRHMAAAELLALLSEPATQHPQSLQSYPEVYAEEPVYELA